jgi:hypothetical protein
MLFIHFLGIIYSELYRMGIRYLRIDISRINGLKSGRWWGHVE